MKIIFYGRLAESIAPELELDVPAGLAVRDLRRRLRIEYPDASATLTNRRALVCVSGSLVRDDFIVRPDDRVEFLSPVSGG